MVESEGVMAINYGRDLSCLNRLETGRTVTGTELVLQAIYRRLITPRGSVIDAPNYGTNIEELLSRAYTKEGLASIPGIIRAEVLKDERVLTATVKARFETFPNVRLVVEIDCTSAAGPFDLTLGVSEVSTELLKATP